MSRYLSTFSIPGKQECADFIWDALVVRCLQLAPRYHLNTWKSDETYPFMLFEESKTFEFESLTIFYGNNGCEKSTMLNLIAASLQLKRHSDINTSPFFDLVRERLCKIGMTSDFDDIGRQAEIITSDDVFKHVQQLRGLNKEISKERDKSIDYIFSLKALAAKGEYQPKPANNREECIARFKEIDALRHTSSHYVRNHSRHNLRNRSNGESALEFFTSCIKDEGLYLLDEPENSLSPSFQIKLIEYLQYSLRLGCQFVIATHSPLLLGMPGARIYNFDDPTFPITDWRDLENIRIYYSFFKEHECEFT